MNAKRICLLTAMILAISTAIFIGPYLVPIVSSAPPDVITNQSTDVTASTAKLLGYLNGTGGKTTLVYFQYKLGLFYAWQTSPLDTTIEYYFDDYDSTKETWLNPTRMTDTSWEGEDYCSEEGGTLNNSQYLNNNTCNEPQFPRITKVEVYVLGVSDVYTKVVVTPTFLDGGVGDQHYARPNLYNIYNDWIDITTDTNAPATWNSSNVQNLTIRLQPSSSYRDCFVGCVKLRVTYNSSGLTSPTIFFHYATDLKPGTTYDFRTVGINDDGWTNASDLKSFTTSLPIYSYSTESLEETSVALYGYLNYTTSSSECGFWIGDISDVNESNKLFNSSFGNVTGDYFIDYITGLTSGEYYYAKAWCVDPVHGFYNSSNEVYFLTKPNKPTSLTKTGSNSSNITLSWDKATVPAGTNLTTVITYKESSYPSSVSDGTLAYNGSAETCTVEGLKTDTDYYFSAWTYINASGSPFYWWYSDTYETATGGTSGGSFNITLLWECNQTLIDNTTADYLNTIISFETYDGRIIHQNTSITTNPYSILLTEFPDIIIVDYDNSGMKRSVIVRDGIVNYTIYVCCYPEWDKISDDYSNYQIFYTFSFLDFTPNSFYTINNRTELDIYKYNVTTKYYIHEDYLDAQDTVTVALHYGERYFLGIRNPIRGIDFIQYIDTRTDTSFEVTINEEGTNVFTIYDYVIVNTSRVTNSMWINYTDSSFSTVAVNMSIYITYPNNNTTTLKHLYNFSSDSEHYLWTSVNGYLLNESYYILLNINNSLFTENQSFETFSPSIYINQSITNVDYINFLINSYLMTCPVPGLSWTRILTFFFVFIISIAVGIKFPSISFIVAGLLLAFINAFLFAENQVITVGAILLGVVLIVLGIIFARGDLE